MQTERFPYTFRSDPANVSILKELGVDIVGIANNHVCDYGLEALSDTIRTLDEAGIPNVGAGNNLEEAKRPWYFVANGRKIAFVAATQIERTYNYTKEATDTTPGVLKTLNPDMTFRRFWKAMRESVMTACKLMLIVSVASLFGWILSVEAFPVKVVAAMTSLTNSKYVIMLLIIVLLLFVGCFMETIAALTILVPVLNPLALSYGIDNIQFAMLFIVTLLIGAITPPVGVNLYITSGIAGIKFADTLKYLPQFILLATVVCLLIMFVPGITTWLPAIAGFGM